MLCCAPALPHPGGACSIPSDHSCPAPPSAASPLQPLHRPDSSDAHKIFNNHQLQLIKLNNQIPVSGRAPEHSVGTLPAAIAALETPHSNPESIIASGCCISECELFAGCLVHLLAKAACFKTWFPGDQAVSTGFWRTCPALSCSAASLAMRFVVSKSEFGGFWVFDWVFLRGIGGFFWQNSWPFLFSRWAAVGDDWWYPGADLICPAGTSFTPLVVLVGGNRWIHW